MILKQLCAESASWFCYWTMFSSDSISFCKSWLYFGIEFVFVNFWYQIMYAFWRRIIGEPKHNSPPPPPSTIHLEFSGADILCCKKVKNLQTNQAGVKKYLAEFVRRLPVKPIELGVGREAGREAGSFLENCQSVRSIRIQPPAIMSVFTKLPPSLPDSIQYILCGSA